MLTDFEQKELERLKSLTGVHTMSGEDIDLMLKAINLPIETRERIMNDLQKGFKKDGSNRLMRAFIEGVMTEQEWLAWKAQGLDEEDFSTILGALDAQKQITDGDTLKVVTTPDSNLFRLREQIQIRFGIEIMEVGEANRIMKEQLEKVEK